MREAMLCTSTWSALRVEDDGSCSAERHGTLRVEPGAAIFAWRDPDGLPELDRLTRVSPEEAEVTR